MKIPILAPECRWECPNCNFKDITYESSPHTRFHSCRELKGLTAPMVREGTRCEIKATEREDYVGKEMVTRDGDNRPIMNVVTTRDDGQDCTVFAPCVGVEPEVK